MSPKPKPEEPPPVQGEKPGQGVVVSDDTLRRLRERGGRVEQPPAKPVKSA